MSLRPYRVEVGGRSYWIAADPASRVANRLQHGIPYEHRLLHYIHGRKYSGIAIDVGAHIGNHALFFACVCGLEVIAFEPLHWKECRDNVDRNDADVRVEPVALGDREGWAQPLDEQEQIAPASGWGVVELRACEAGAPGALPVRTLDSYALTAGRICLIKIDVEGMEAEVLRGAGATIRTHRPDLYIEARDAAAHELIAEVLRPWEYTHTLTARTSTPVEVWMALSKR